MIGAMGFPKLVVLALVFAAAWVFMRWVNRAQHELPRRRSAPRRAIEAEDLTPCPTCRAYVVEGSPPCGRPDCPRLG